MANWAQKMKLHHLQMLVALGEQGNLTHVARMMNISQPALSKWLSQLEDEIGITLFERHSKGLRPSEEETAASACAALGQRSRAFAV